MNPEIILEKLDSEMVPEVEKEKPKLSTPVKAEPGEDDELR